MHAKDLKDEIAKKMSEKELTSKVIDVAHKLGYLAYHQQSAVPARMCTRCGATVRGGHSLIQGDAGFPDLVLVRNGRILFVELKREKGGKLTPSQEQWLLSLGVAALKAPNIKVQVWHPSHLKTGIIDKILVSRVHEVVLSHSPREAKEIAELFNPASDARSAEDL